MDNVIKYSFINAFKAMQQEAHDINVAKGFNSQDVKLEEIINHLNDNDDFVGLDEQLKQAHIGLKLMLVVSELAEGLESIRKGDEPDSHIPEFTGMEAELADAVIRIMNLATDSGLRVAEAIIAKSEYNANRPYKHGGKKF